MKKIKNDYKELNDILNTWDFLEVMDEENQNEYTDLIPPILNGLQEGMSQKELSECIIGFVTQQYGTVPAGSYEISEDILKWWKRN